MTDLLRKKEYKQIKKEIADLTAVGVGYFNEVFNHIPEYALFEAIREITTLGWVKHDTDDVDLRNMLVTESIKYMNYQDFKQVAPHFFSFPYDQRQEFYRAQPIEVSREIFEQLQDNAEELFALKASLANKNNDIAFKINDLETDKVENGDKVIGVDLDNEMLLLRRTPETAYIDDWEVLRDNLLVEYRSELTAQQQVVDYLVSHYFDIEVLAYEYVLDHDLYRGYADVDRYAISELQPTDVPNFNTQREFYDYAVQFDSFNERYSTYDDYIMARYQFVYEYSLLEYQYYAQEFMNDKLEDINAILLTQDKELVWHEVAGYSQSERWDLAYLRDVPNETLDSVEYYLEHEIGAWYKNSLTELALIPFEAFDFEKGYDGTVENKYYVDIELLWHDELKHAKALFPDLKSFVAPEMINQDKQLSQNINYSKGVSL